jgi:hypothetical protein
MTDQMQLAPVKLTNKHTAMTVSSRIVGHDALSIANTRGTKGSGSAFNHRMVQFQTSWSAERDFAFVTNERAHRVVSEGILEGGLRVESADDEGLFCWADGESASDGAPKEGRVRCLLVGRCAIAHTSIMTGMTSSDCAGGDEFPYIPEEHADSGDTIFKLR